MTTLGRLLQRRSALRPAYMAHGTVTGTPADRQTLVVNLYGGTITVQKDPRYVANIGDTVVLFHDGERIYGCFPVGPHASGASPTISTATPSQPAPKPPRPAKTNYKRTFPCPAADTWQASRWMGTGRLYQGTYGGSAHTGLWLYGNALTAALAGATIASLEIYVPRSNASGDYAAQTVNIVAHAHASRPAGAPTVGSVIATVSLPRGAAAWVPIPLANAQQLTTGAIRGFGITGPPYLRCEGPAGDPQSGSLRARYSA